METRDVGRFEWERLLRRIVMPQELKFAAFALATWGNLDGSRVRPGSEVLGASMGKSERTARRMIESLCVDWGLLRLVARGGGRGRGGKTSEYRLTIPLDALDRFRLLGPDGLPDPELDSPDIQVSGQFEDSPATQMAGDCGQLLSTGGDNSEPPDTQMSGQSTVDNSIDRTNSGLAAELTGHQKPIDRTPRCPTTGFRPDQLNETRDQSPPSATTDRDPVDVDNSNPSHGRTLDDLLPLSKPPKPPPGAKCPHGLAADRHPDGRPRCPLCRRDAVLDAHPIPVPEFAPPERP